MNKQSENLESLVLNTISIAQAQPNQLITLMVANKERKEQAVEMLNFLNAPANIKVKYVGEINENQR